MKKVLMISYSFPPIAGGGVFRTLKFVKHLPSFGYAPIVLSVKKSKFKEYDPLLLNYVPNNAKIYRAYNFESRIYRYAGSYIGINYKWYQIPDVFITWLPFAISKAKKIIKKDRPIVLYSSSPPPSIQVISLLLKKKTNLPWVADFRDPWTDNFVINYPTNFHKNFEENLEKKVLRYADRVILNTDSNKEAVIKKFPEINAEKLLVIPNGFDIDDFKDVKEIKTDKFTIGSVGSLYDVMNPGVFLKAVAEILKERPEIKENIKIIFAGNTDSKSKDIIESFDFKEVVDFKGYVSYEKSIEIMKLSDVLLLILPPQNKDAQRAIAQRMFNYIAANKKIIAMVSEGESSEIIKKANAGVIVDPGSVNDIKAILLNLYESWKKNTLAVDIDKNYIKRFDRRQLTKKLAETFDEII